MVSVTLFQILWRKKRFERALSRCHRLVRHLPVSKHATPQLIRQTNSGAYWCNFNKQYYNVLGLSYDNMVHYLVNSYLLTMGYTVTGDMGADLHRANNAVTCISRVWRWYQVKRMRPFSIVPTSHTDSTPYLEAVHYITKRLEKPSFKMIYFKINNTIVGIDRSVMQWEFDNDGNIYFGTRKWVYGVDFTIRINIRQRQRNVLEVI